MRAIEVPDDVADVLEEGRYIILDEDTLVEMAGGPHTFYWPLMLLAVERSYVDDRNRQVVDVSLDRWGRAVGKSSDTMRHEFRQLHRLGWTERVQYGNQSQPSIYEVTAPWAAGAIVEGVIDE